MQLHKLPGDVKAQAQAAPVLPACLFIREEDAREGFLLYTRAGVGYADQQPALRFFGGDPYTAVVRPFYRIMDQIEENLEQPLLIGPYMRQRGGYAYMERQVLAVR